MKLMAIDGNSIVNRAFYGVRPLSTRDGLPTHAVYGFLTILQKLRDEEKPDAVCVAFDLRGPTFRHEAFEGYKAKRKGMPEELAMQIPVLKEVLDAMNIRRYELEGWEADDLIGTIARRCGEEGWECSLVTGDKDSLQLITDQTHVKLVSTRMGLTETKEMDPAAFREVYGFEPPKIVDLKALMGDSSDNIPGVPGIGEKTALELIRNYGSVDAIYEKLDGLDIKPAVRKKLEEGKESARSSYELATIHTDAPIGFSPEDALCGPVNREELYQLFLRLEFSKLIDRYGLTPGTPGESAGNNARFTAQATGEIVTEEARAGELLRQWENEDHVTVRVLPGLDGVDAVVGPHLTIFLQNRLENYNEILKGLFGGKIRLVSHEVKDLMHKLLDEGLPARGFVFDTALAAYLLAPTDGSYALEKLGLCYFNHQFPTAREYEAPDAFSPLANPVPAIAALSSHAGLIDALYEILAPKLEELGMCDLYYQVELPLCPVLAKMERAGFLVDRKALAGFGQMLTGRIEGARAEIFKAAGEEFNINSTQQLGAVLFDKLGLPPVKKTKTGYSTNVEVLEKLRGFHPIIDSIMEYRQLTKLSSTYVEGLTKVICPDGRIRTSLQNTVTATGRLSSTEPNLQNIPIRTELGSELRRMFVAPPDCVLVDADYSQIELRLLAHMAHDKAMIDAFKSGEDIHTITASQVFGVSPTEVTGEMRRRAKAVNFGIVYGISAFSLAQDIGVFQNEARTYMERYFAKYHGVREYMDRVVAEAKENGYVSTLMGRRRPLPELRSSDRNLRSFGERVALNMPIQGTAADVMKLAMIHADEALTREVPDARLVLQVHDELIVECPQEKAEQVKKLLTREMESVMELSVPLIAEAGAGRSWAEAH
ncbi:DNA polymerase I [bioreactor metagenome]|uniref:DNA-directed DNA polymerase n=1 Tax=bioreactor metagenome TaxID=1076179 RepID=A0A644WG88_9ZZZZ